MNMLFIEMLVVIINAKSAQFALRKNIAKLTYQVTVCLRMNYLFFNNALVYSDAKRFRSNVTPVTRDYCDVIDVTSLAAR